MKTICYLIISTTCLLFCSTNSFATHNLAGEFTYKPVVGNPYTYQFTLITYTSTGPNVQADRCFITLSFGDGDTITVPCINGAIDNSATCTGTDMGEIVVQPINGNNGVRKNIYIVTHTYASAGIYDAYYSDPNYSDGIINISNSINCPEKITAEVNISLTPFIVPNNSPDYAAILVDTAYYCQTYTYNNSTTEIDGDNLQYELINPPGICTSTIPSGASIDAVTGVFTWACPGPNIGNYIFCIKINEYRAGVFIGYTTRLLHLAVFSYASIQNINNKSTYSVSIINNNLSLILLMKQIKI